MSRPRYYNVHAGFAVFLVVALAGPARAAGAGFESELDPAPFDATNKADTVGIGDVTGSLDGRSLTIAGTFSGLSSPATGAQLRMGLAMGVPGEVVGALSVAKESSGAVSGRIDLNAKQLAALRARSLYIRIDSAKAPDGNLQGWLEPKGE
jgi:CHRD domain